MADGGRERVRRPDLVPLQVLLFGGVGLACLGLAVWPGGAASAGVRIAFGLAAIAFAILVARLLPMGVYVDDDGVEVRNFLSSRRIPWAQIDRFAMGLHKGFGSFPCGVAHLGDGEVLVIGALNPSLGGEAQILPLIDDLNGRLGRATGRT
jgi:hypothetical protein